MSSCSVRVFAVAGIVALAPFSSFPVTAQEILGGAEVRGAGSTFVFPLLSRWSREHRAQLAHGGFTTPNAGLEDGPAASALEYPPVGSLGGILRVKDRAVDFAASEMPLQSHELETWGVRQFPIVVGGVAVALNVDGIAPGAIRFSGPVLADVFLGKITRWSDPAIRALNPSLSLPDLQITVVHRADGSGTTFNFDSCLSNVSPEWKVRVGAAMLVRWPTGMPAKGTQRCLMNAARDRFA